MSVFTRHPIKVGFGWIHKASLIEGYGGAHWLLASAQVTMNPFSSFCRWARVVQQTNIQQLVYQHSVGLDFQTSLEQQTQTSLVSLCFHINLAFEESIFLSLSTDQSLSPWPSPQILPAVATCLMSALPSCLDQAAQTVYFQTYSCTWKSSMSCFCINRYFKCGTDMAILCIYFVNRICQTSLCILVQWSKCIGKEL